VANNTPRQADARKGQGVSLIMTARNEAASIEAFLDGLAAQTCPPDETVIVDGGSTDGTAEAIQRRIEAGARIRLIVAPGANISRGRNLAIAAAAGPLIAATDAGCRLEPDWLERLVRPLCEDPALDVAGGFYAIDTRTPFEEVSGLLTLPGQLQPVDPATFLPSTRSVAFRKWVWERAGGFPEWLYTAEDTLFDLKLKALGCRFAFVPEAVVHWRPYGAWRKFARAFFRYGVGSGRTATHAAGYHYTTRQHLVALLLAALGCFRWWGWVAFAVWVLYGFLFTVLPTMRRVRWKTGRWSAAWLSALLIELRRLAGAAGYWSGRFQRLTRPARYKRLQEKYMRPETEQGQVPPSN
jgi:glycosyltransferase involved in cell wall biosynthesis